MKRHIRVCSADFDETFKSSPAKMISDREGPRVVQSWFTGLNPELNDPVPVRLLREEKVEAVGPEILGAARAFLAGG